MKGRTVFAELTYSKRDRMDDKRNRGNRDGVTLVEVIMVMVILAVLAAVTVPSLLGFIRKVKVQQYVMEAYSVKGSAQMYVTERYADGTLDDHRAMMKMIEGKLTSDKHVLYPYLRVKCSPGAQLKGATFKIDTGVLLEIVYQVGKYKITINEYGEQIEIVPESPR